MGFWKNMFGRGKDENLNQHRQQAKQPGELVDQLNQQATELLERKEYQRAMPLATQACDLARESLSQRDPTLATSLNNLALLYKELGNYTGAERLYEQALKIYRAIQAEHDPLFSTSLSNLAALYGALGDYTKAIPLYQRALEIDRVALGENHPNVAFRLNNLGMEHLALGELASAEEYTQQALEVRRTALGEQHPLFAASLSNLALIHLEMGNYAEAERLYRQALDTKLAVFGDQPSVSVASNLSALGRLHHRKGNYVQAESFYRRALEIVRTVLGEDHAALANVLANLARLYVATEREKDALPLMQRAAVVRDGVMGQVFSIGSESQRMAYLKTLQQEFDTFLSLISRHPAEARDAAQGLQLVLRRKAIGAEALAAQRDAVLGGHNPQLASRLQELTILRVEIARKTLAGPGSEGLEAHQQLLAEKNTQKERLEAELARQIPEMNLDQQLRTADRQAVAEALPEGAVLVEFVRFDVYDFEAVPARNEPRWKPARYLAFIMPAGEPDDVRMIDLGEAEPIDKMIASFRVSITGEAEPDGERVEDSPSVEPSRVSVRSDRSNLRAAIFATRHAKPRSMSEEGGNNASLGSALREALFDPLIPALNGRTRLFVAPDGDLARLPFEVLPVRDGRHLIVEYRISYLGVGRDVLRFGTESTGQPGPPLVAADPDFDLQVVDGGRSSAAGAPFERLRGTRREGERIAGLLGVAPLLESSALEARIKDSRSPLILHVATHGFFLPDAPRDPRKDQPEPRTMVRAGVDGLARLAQVESPLLRSGLALAGANIWLGGGALPEEAEDAILNAEDVTGLDLLATELVVLSACETGLGQVHVGEGVYGLRRAFVLAGAKTLVMSLWKVPDEQTQELMENFYRYLLRGKPRAEALREAQLRMKAKYPDPLYWGAFICQGDPSPLPR